MGFRRLAGTVRHATRFIHFSALPVPSPVDGLRSGGEHQARRACLQPDRRLPGGCRKMVTHTLASSEPSAGDRSYV